MMAVRTKSPQEETVDRDSLLDESPEDAIKRLTEGRGEKGPYPIEECIAAFIEGDGYLSRAARVLGVTTVTFEKYVKRYKALKELVIDYQTARLDEAERHLMIQVRKGDVSAIRFYLTTQGKARGYMPESKINTDNKSKSDTNITGSVSMKSYLEFARSVMFKTEASSK